MSKVTRMVLERIIDRCVAIVAGIVGSTLSTISAQRQAEQLGEMEDLATEYEKTGKHEAADTMRSHARRIAENSSAKDPLSMLDNVLTADDQTRLAAEDVSQPLRLSNLPSKPRRKRRAKVSREES